MEVKGTIEVGWVGLLGAKINIFFQALNHNMSKKINSSEASAASNAAPDSPMNKRTKPDRTALAMTATPSDEVMNALFEQVAVREDKKCIIGY